VGFLVMNDMAFHFTIVAGLRFPPVILSHLLTGNGNVVQLVKAESK
jgi:hypothetical protein